jgi:hypothetical protein
MAAGIPYIARAWAAHPSSISESSHAAKIKRVSPTVSANCAAIPRIDRDLTGISAIANRAEDDVSDDRVARGAGRSVRERDLV